MDKIKGKILSLPITIGALVILIVVGIYLVLYVRQTNQTASPTTSGTPSVTNQTTPETPDSSDTSGTTDNSDSSDETADWQTYTSDQYGFSFKYPKDYKVEEVDPSAKTMALEIQINRQDNYQKIKDYKGVIMYQPSSDSTIIVFSNLKDFAAFKGQFQDVSTTAELNNKLNELSYQKLFVGDAEFYKKEFDDTYLSNLSIIGEVDGRIYQIDVSLAYYESSNSIFNQILSTFKFTD